MPSPVVRPSAASDLAAPWRRHAIGLLAIAFAISAGAVSVWGSPTAEQLWTGSALRLAALGAIIWIAWPDLVRLPLAWVLSGVAVLAVVLVLAPRALPAIGRLLPLALGAMAVLYGLRVVSQYLGSGPPRAGR